MAVANISCVTVQVKDNGGIMTMGDLAGYEARMEEPLHIDYSGMCSVRSRGSLGELGPLILA